MEEDVDVGGRPFSGSMRRSGSESRCNDDTIKRKIIQKRNEMMQKDKKMIMLRLLRLFFC